MGALRVSEHYIPNEKMHPRQAHRHAGCYHAEAAQRQAVAARRKEDRRALRTGTPPDYSAPAASDVAWGPDLAYGSGLLAASGEDLTPLRDALHFDNAAALKVKKNQFAPVARMYPAGTITFDDDQDYGAYGQASQAEIEYAGPNQLVLRTAPKNPKGK